MIDVVLEEHDGLCGERERELIDRRPGGLADPSRRTVEAFEDDDATALWLGV